MEFAYEATDAEGSLFTGHVDAETMDGAASHVRSRGLVPLKLVASDGRSVAEPAPTDSPFAQVELPDDYLSRVPETKSVSETAKAPKLDLQGSDLAELLGPPPPPLPRIVAGVGLRYAFKGPLVGFAAMWSLISVPMFVVFLFSGELFPTLFLAGFVAIGWYIGQMGWKPALKRMKVWEQGVATPAIITSTGRETSYSVNGQNPFKMEYAFDLEGVLHDGVRTSFDSTITRYETGQPIWVVYLPEDPSISAEWPPLL